MRHRNTGRQFGRNSSHRKAMFRSLVTSLIANERIETTEAKAKEVRGIAERIITLGKKGDLSAKRMAFSYIRSRDAVAKLFGDIAPRVANREGGYTRITKTRIRYGDSAPMAILELVDKPGEVYQGPAKKAAPKAGKAAAKPKAAPGKKKAKVKEPEAVAEAVVEGPKVEAAGEEAVAEAPAKTEGEAEGK